jgi:hypothetical protein
MASVAIAVVERELVTARAAQAAAEDMVPPQDEVEGILHDLLVAVGDGPGDQARGRVKDLEQVLATIRGSAAERRGRYKAEREARKAQLAAETQKVKLRAAANARKQKERAKRKLLLGDTLYNRDRADEQQSTRRKKVAKKLAARAEMNSRLEAFEIACAS